MRDVGLTVCGGCANSTEDGSLDTRANRTNSASPRRVEHFFGCSGSPDPLVVLLVASAGDALAGIATERSTLGADIAIWLRRAYCRPHNGYQVGDFPSLKLH